MTNEEFIKSITLEGEEWRGVAGWEGCYMVSNIGRVVSLGRNFTRRNGTHYSVKPRLLKPNTTKHNGILYNYICLRENCDRTVVAIHRLVAIAFIPNPSNYSEIDHIDRNGLNNNVDNLRWCNRFLNMSNPNTRKALLEGQRRRRMRESLVKSVAKERLPDAWAVKRLYETSAEECRRNGY